MKKKAGLPYLDGEAGQMRRECGGTSICALLCGTVLLALVPISDESFSYAGTLKNSVRVGDRSGMNIVKVPRAGEARLPLPGPDRRVLSEEPRRPSGGESRTVRRGGLRAVGPQDWFWKVHQTDRGAGSPLRWGQAIETMRQRRRRSSPIASQRLLADIVGAYGQTIAAAAERHTISEALIAAVIAVESAGRERAKSHAGAQGLMQLMPATARRFGVANSYIARENIFGGAAYLSWLLNNFGQDPLLALAGYNAGEGAVARHNGVPPYRETRDYVVKVFDALVAVESLCLQAPDTPRSPCDWQLAQR